MLMQIKSAVWIGVELTLSAVLVYYMLGCLKTSFKYSKDMGT